ncbi:MAG: hypothetical protein WBE73_01065 [Candidatus Acidiferrum sp.]
MQKRFDSIVVAAVWLFVGRHVFCWLDLLNATYGPSNLEYCEWQQRVRSGR